MDVQPVYLEHAPSIWLDDPLLEADFIPDERAELLASGLFSGVEVRRYRWDDTYDAERNVRILRTHALPAKAREALLACWIEERYGGSITRATS